MRFVLAGVMAPKRTSSSGAESSHAGSSSAVPPFEWPSWDNPTQLEQQPMDTDAPPQGVTEEEDVNIASEEDVPPPQEQE